MGAFLSSAELPAGIEISCVSAVRALPASEGSQRSSLHVLDDQARGVGVQVTERAIARLLGNWRRPRARVTASVLQG